MTDLGIEKLHEMLKKGEVSSEELVKESIRKSHEVEDKCNAFVTIMDDTQGGDVTDDLLSGIPYGIKDNYSTKDILSTGSSNTLKDYVPFFDATAVANLKKYGAVAVNKTALDEFGMGGTGTTAHTGIIRNPWDTLKTLHTYALVDKRDSLPEGLPDNATVVRVPLEPTEIAVPVRLMSLERITPVLLPTTMEPPCRLVMPSP